MKLRQKLAAVLAAAMVVTAVPVVTMAYSTAGVTKVVTTTDDEKTLTEQGISSDLKIDLKDGFTEGEFYIKLEGAEWSDKTTSAAVKVEVEGGTTVTALFEREDSTEARITVNGDLADDATLRIPLGSAIVKKDEAFINIDGNNTEVSDAKITFAKKTDAKVAVSAGDATTIYTGTNKIATLKFEESAAGKIENGTYRFDLSLDTDEYDFVSAVETANSTLQAKGVRGLSDANVTAEVKADGSEAELILTVSGLPTGASRGRIEVEGIQVKSNTKTPTLGDIKVDVSNGTDTDLVTSGEVKVATVADYDVTLSVKDDKKVEINSGRDEKVTFSMKQTMEEALVQGRDVEFTIENGYFVIADINGKTIDGLGTPVAGDPINTDEDAADWEKKVTDTFTVKVTDATEKEFKFEDVKIAVPANVTGDVTIKADGRAIGKEVSAVVAEGVAPFEVKTETMMLETGVKEQKGGKIVITETDKAKFEKGNIVISLADENGIEFKKGDIKVDATNLKVDEDKVKVEYYRTTDAGYKLVIPVTRTSKEAASITIEGLNVKVDRTVPTGTYDLAIGGSAIATYGDLKVEDFFQVGELGGLVKGTTSFTMGSNKYTINGEEKEMDATPFVSAKGRTMVPVRYLGQALGADVQFINGTVIIKAGATTITVANNSNIAYVNGSPVTMDEKVQIVNNRTYAPASQIGNILGVEPGWDQATQTATFTSK